MSRRDRLSPRTTATTQTRRLRWPSWVAILLAPLVLAGAFVWATYHADDRLGRVQAAIVNHDEPVKINGQTVPLGRQLTAGLVEGASDDPDLNLSWVLSDDADARDGLASGRYAAVITIPTNFSAAATSTAHPDGAAQATIGVETSDITAIADSALTTVVSNVAISTLNSTLTETYLDNIYLGFNSISKSFGTAADGAQDLADGAGKFATGVDQSATGTQKLATGLDKLSNGATQLSDGSPALRSGGTKISTGFGDLATQTSQLPQQSKQLASGVRKIATGARGLADGAKKLDTGATQLATGAKANAAGAKKLDTGATQLATGAKANAAGVKKLDTGATQLATGAKANAAGAKTYAAGVGTYRTAMNGIAQFGIVVDGQPYCPPELTAQAPAELAPQLCAAFTAGTQAGGAAAVQGLDGTAAQPGLVTGATALSAGAAQLSTGASGVATGVGALSAGAAQLSTGASGVATGVGALSDGAAQLSTGASGVAKGVSGLSTGATQLSTGADQAATGTEKFAVGIGQLASGISSAPTGLDSYVAGVATYSRAVDQIATGIGSSATGTQKLADGLDKLSDGADGLATGTAKLADGLATGAEKIPTYDAAQRKRLSTAVANPVTTGASGISLPELSSTSLLIALALFAGGLISFLVLRALPARSVTSCRASWQLLLLGLAPAAVIGVVQAVVLTLIGRFVLDLSATDTAGLLGLAVLASVTFAAVCQTLVIWAGDLGRLSGLAAVGLTAAGGIVSAVPEFFDGVRPFLPLTPLVDGIRALVTGGAGLGGAVGLLGLWLLLALVAGVVGVAKDRVLSPNKLAQLPALA